MRKFLAVLLFCLAPISQAITQVLQVNRLAPPKIIELPIRDTNVNAVDGSNLTIPDNAIAVSLNVTSVNAQASGFFTI